MLNTMNSQFLVAAGACNMAALSGYALCYFWGLNKKSAISPAYRPMPLLLLLWAASIAAITIIPLPFASKKIPLSNEINYLPVYFTFRQLYYYLTPFNYLLILDWLENFVGNILMFIPLGILAPHYYPRYAHAKKIGILGMSCSIGIESVQLISRALHIYRHVDVDDVLLNTLGVYIGYAIFKIGKRIRANLREV